MLFTTGKLNDVISKSITKKNKKSQPLECVIENSFYTTVLKCVCVCVCVCVCACVRACVLILFHHKSFFRLQRCLGHTSGYGSTILCFEYHAGCFCQVPSFLYLKMSYFTSKDENSSKHKLGRKRYNILDWPKDDIY